MKKILLANCSDVSAKSAIEALQKSASNVSEDMMVITGLPYSVRKTKKKKIGMKIFTAMNWMAVIVCIVSACAVDSASWLPAMVCALSAAYLGCALYVSEVIRVRSE